MHANYQLNIWCIKGSKKHASPSKTTGSRYLITECTLWIIENCPIYIDDTIAVTQYRSQSMNEYIHHDIAWLKLYTKHKHGTKKWHQHMLTTVYVYGYWNNTRATITIKMAYLQTTPTTECWKTPRRKRNVWNEWVLTYFSRSHLWGNHVRRDYFNI